MDDSLRNSALRAEPASHVDAGRAVLDALRNGIPLTEPVYIRKALLAGREAKVVLDGGTGPASAVHLVNIGLTGWIYTPKTAEAYAEGYNTALKHYRNALLELADSAEADAASRGRAQGGITKPGEAQP